MSIFSSKSTALAVNSVNPEAPGRTSSDHPQRTFSNESNDSGKTLQQKLLPKSPSLRGSKLGSLFGWGGNISPSSSTTTFSDKAYSPASPYTSEDIAGRALAGSKGNAKILPSAIDIPKANADAGGYFDSAYLQIPLATPVTPSSPLLVVEMEKELKEISTELASSIRREMDLEDLVERLQAEAQNSSTPSKRTSDYFSDSGTSSVRYGGESDPKQDELDRMQRKTEQERAQIKLELTDKVQDERSRRKQLEVQIRVLEERASHVSAVYLTSYAMTDVQRWILHR